MFWRALLLSLVYGTKVFVYDAKANRFNESQSEGKPLAEEKAKFIQDPTHPFTEQVAGDFLNHPDEYFANLDFQSTRALIQYMIGDTAAVTKVLEGHLDQLSDIPMYQQQAICAALSPLLLAISSTSWSPTCLDAMLYRYPDLNDLKAKQVLFQQIKAGLYDLHLTRAAKGTLTSDQIHLMQAFEHCDSFSHILPGLAEKQRALLSAACVEKMARHLPVDDLAKMPASWLLMHSDIIIRAYGKDALGQDTGDRIKDIPTALLVKMIGGKGVHGCKALTTAQLDAIIASGDGKRKSLLTADCIGWVAAKQLLSIAAHPDIGTLRQDWLAKVSFPLRFTNAVETHLKSKQLEHVQAKADPAVPCAGLQLARLSPTQAKSLTPACLKGILSQRQEQVSDDKVIKALKFDSFKTGEETIASLQAMGSNLADLSANQVTTLLADPMVCAVMPISHAKATISAECFKVMPAEQKSHWLQLQGKKLKEAVLQLDADELSQLKFTNKKGTEEKGLSILQALFDADTVSHLGLSVPLGPHPCRLIKDLDQVKDMKVLSRGVTTNCLTHTSVMTSSWDDLKGHESLLGKLAWEDQWAIVEDHWQGEWSKVPVAQMTSLFAGGVFCRHATGHILNQLTGDQWSTVTGPCIAQMTAIGELKQLEHLPPTAFTHLNTRQANRIGLGRLMALKDAVWAEMSKEVPAGPLNVGSMLVGIKSWTVERVAVLPKTALASLSRVSCASLTVEQLKAIPAVNLRGMTRSQVEMMAKILSNLSAEQVAEIGIEHRGTPQDPIHVLRQIKFNSEGARKAMKTRSWASSHLAQSMLVVFSSIITLFMFISA